MNFHPEAFPALDEADDPFNNQFSCLFQAVPESKNAYSPALDIDIVDVSLFSGLLPIPRKCHPSWSSMSLIVIFPIPTLNRILVSTRCLVNLSIVTKSVKCKKLPNPENCGISESYEPCDEH